MNQYTEAIHQLKAQGLSIRAIMDRLDLKKHVVETALHQLPMRPDRPDEDWESCPDDDDDAPSDRPTKMSGRVVLVSEPISAKDLPSEWYSGVSRVEADFIIIHHLEQRDALTIKARYEDQHPDGYLSLSAIRHVVQAYEQDEARQNRLKASAHQAKADQLFQQFTQFVGADLLAFLQWLHDSEDWKVVTMTRCLAQATTLAREIDRFCQQHKLAPRQYEPYMILEFLKSGLETGIRKRNDPLLDDQVHAFMDRFTRNQSLDRYYWKMVASPAPSQSTESWRYR